MTYNRLTGALNETAAFDLSPVTPASDIELRWGAGNSAFSAVTYIGPDGVISQPSWISVAMMNNVQIIQVGLYLVTFRLFSTGVSTATTSTVVVRYGSYFGQISGERTPWSSTDSLWSNTVLDNVTNFGDGGGINNPYLDILALGGNLGTTGSFSGTLNITKIA